MAETLITNIMRHIGTAAEKAAMSTSALKLGSEWKETDTGKIYNWDGSTWAVFGGERDALFDIPVAIDVAHHEVHEGDAFRCSIVDVTLASAAAMALAFKTPAGTKHVHIVMEFITLTGGHVELLRAPTWVAQTGSAEAISNHFDGAGSSAILENEGQAGFVASDNMIGNPTTLAGGTVILTKYAFGQKNFFPGAGREVQETVLAADTQYAFRFTSDAASNKAFMALDWYEHTDS